MLKNVVMRKSALLGSALAIAVASPLAMAQADEPMRLDLAQLDSITAAAEAGIGLFAIGESFGTVNSLSTTTFTGQSQSNPVISTASGTITQFNLGIGGTGANTPFAVADTGPIMDEAAGDRFFTYQLNRSGNGRGYAWAVSVTHKTAVGSEFPF